MSGSHSLPCAWNASPFEDEALSPPWAAQANGSGCMPLEIATSPTAAPSASAPLDANRCWPSCLDALPASSESESDGWLLQPFLHDEGGALPDDSTCTSAGPAASGGSGATRFCPRPPAVAAMGAAPDVRGALMHAGDVQPCCLGFVPVHELLCLGCRSRLAGAAGARCRAAAPAPAARQPATGSPAAPAAPAGQALAAGPAAPLTEAEQAAAEAKRKAARRREQRRRRRNGLPLRFPSRRLQAQAKPRVKGRFVKKQAVEEANVDPAAATDAEAAPVPAWSAS
eukprot:scaffold28.g7555.t1